MIQKNFIAKSAFISYKATICHPTSIGKEAEVHDRSFLGEYSLLNNYSILYSDTVVGRYCSIGRFVEIGADAHPMHFLSSSNLQYSNTLMRGHEDTTFKRKIGFEYKRNTTIGHDVWIGAKSVIKSGINVGVGSVVAALSFVNKDVPPYAIVGGIPARIIRYRFPEEIILRLLDLEWWQLKPIDMRDVDFDNIDLAIDQIEKIKKHKSL